MGIIVRSLRAAVAIGASLCLTVSAAPQGAPRDDVAPGAAIASVPQGPSGYRSLGQVVFGPLDVEDLPSPPNIRMVGVEQAFGFFWITGGDGSTTFNAAKIYQLDLNGTLLAQFPQTSLISSTFNHRDGEANEAANLMYWGEEGNRLVEYDFHPAGATLSFSRVLILANPGAGGLPSTIRSLARDPSTGLFYTANFGTSVYEFSVPPTGPTATVTRVFPNPTSPPSAFHGMAWDPVNSTLCGWSQNGTPLVRFDEFAVGASALTFTGKRFQGVAAPSSGPTAGGADIYFDTRNCGHLSMIALHQAQPDAIVLYDIATPFGSPCPPVNDDCASALPLSCGGTPAEGSTALATLDAPPACGPAPIAPGVWYRVAGTGYDVTLSTCDASTSFDTRITVYSGSCASLTCVVDNDDAACGSNALASQVTFPTSVGTNYLVLVHGGKLATDIGPFKLTSVCPNYCTAGTTTPCGNDEFISRTIFGAIDNPNPCAPGGYSNFTSLSTPVDIGCPLQIVLEVTHPFTGDQTRAWIDWNQDLDFDDSEEEFFLHPIGDPRPEALFQGEITAPSYALLGQTRLRVGLHFNQPPQPCGSLPFQDYEDYSVLVQPLLDADGDGTPDCIDGCPMDPQKIAPEACGCGVPETDTDGDGTPDCIDGCPDDPLKIEPGACGCGVSDVDTDRDGTPDCIDGCPLDPLKIAPGTCGCGVSDIDTDRDGTPDCIDGCPLDPTKILPGACGCGVPDTDADLDGVLDCVDNCPLAPNPGQDDADGDGVGDACDNCPLHANPAQADCDHNGIGDVCEIASGAQPDCDANGLPDNCEPDCNGNGRADACDIAGGTSLDTNLNGVPDECEAMNGVAFCFGDGSGTPCPCNNASVPGEGCKSSTGRGARLYNGGGTSVSADDAVLVAVQLPAHKPSIFFTGTSQVNGGLGTAFFDGLLCVQPTKRYSAQASSAQGVLVRAQPVAGSGGLITAGSTWYFQCWHRDPLGPCNLKANLSNGLGVSFTP